MTVSTSNYGVSEARNGVSDSKYGVRLLLSVKPKMELVTAKLESTNRVSNSILVVRDSNYGVRLDVLNGAFLW